MELGLEGTASFDGVVERLLITQQPPHPPFKITKRSTIPSRSASSSFRTKSRTCGVRTIEMATPPRTTTTTGLSTKALVAIPVALVMTVDGLRSHTRGRYLDVRGAQGETDHMEEVDVALTGRDIVSWLTHINSSYSRPLISCRT